MPRYFFSVQDGQNIPDHEGTVLSSPDAARVMAVFSSGEMLRAHAEQFWIDRDWQIVPPPDRETPDCD